MEGHITSIEFIIFFITTCCIVSGIPSTTAFNLPSFNTTKHMIEKRQLKNSKFTCRDGSEISSFDVCDGMVNCPDGSDETYSVCLKYGMFGCYNSKAFLCAYGACIDGNKKCDGKFDCVDRSDELSLECPNFVWLNPGVTQTCSTTTWQCRNGQCIDRTLFCDGTPHCSDGTDESVAQCNRDSWVCSSSSFRCGYGACIDLISKCDGKSDCADGSDEDSIICDRAVNGPATPVSHIPPSQPQGTTASTYFTWPILDTTKSPTSTSGCPRKPAGIRHDCLADPPDAPGTCYTHMSENIVKVTCTDNYVFNNTDKPDHIIFCQSDVWYAAPKCVPQCPPLQDISAKYSCRYGINELASGCSTFVRPGTIAETRCEYGYRENSGMKENVCLENGFWKYPQYKCKEDCGIVSRNTPTIAFGRNTTVTEFPWNVAIYKQTNGSFSHICGGSLISRYIVLTAAHCITLESGDLKPTELKIAAGKYNRDWYLSEEGVHISDVVGLYRPKFYKPGTFTYDIGLIEITIPVVFSATIMAICVAPSQHKIPENRQGLVAGWGRDESNVNTNVLKAASFPFISRDRCVSRTTEIIPEDKFCAYVDTGVTVKQGDSGAGLVFAYNTPDIRTRYIIVGIVSTSIKNTDISTFTDVRFNHNSNYISNLQRLIDSRRITEQ